MMSTNNTMRVKFISYILACGGAAWPYRLMYATCPHNCVWTRQTNEHSSWFVDAQLWLSQAKTTATHEYVTSLKQNVRNHPNIQQSVVSSSIALFVVFAHMIYLRFLSEFLSFSLAPTEKLSIEGDTDSNFLYLVFWGKVKQINSEFEFKHNFQPVFLELPFLSTSSTTLAFNICFFSTNTTKPQVACETTTTKDLTQSVAIVPVLINWLMSS